jgi:hypothetical protein
MILKLARLSLMVVWGFACGTKLFSAVPAGTCLAYIRTRHWDVVAPKARNAVQRTGLFSFAANAARSVSRRAGIFSRERDAQKSW